MIQKVHKQDKLLEVDYGIMTAAPDQKNLQKVL